MGTGASAGLAAGIAASSDVQLTTLVQDISPESRVKLQEALKMAVHTPAGESAATVADLKLEINGATFQYISERPLELERVAIYADQFPGCVGADRVVAVLAEGDGAKKEFTALVKGSAASVMKGTCAITLDDLLPSEGIEYTFSEAPDKWAVAQISRQALDIMIKSKFGLWKDMLSKGECEAQLRRMLQAGVVSSLYDDVVFPTPEEYRHHFKVKCEKTGRIVNIPHPVVSLRVWNANTSKYDEIDPALEGAPSEADKETWWTEFLNGLKEQRGADYIEDLLANEPADDELATTVAELKLEVNGGLFTFVSERPLELERMSIYTEQFPACVGADKVVAVIGEGNGEKKEFPAVVKGSSASLIKNTCVITLADLLPSEAVEYSFNEAPTKWAVAQISREALDSYRKSKFELWKDLLLKGECEAQLRRMLQAGAVTSLYDDIVFPTPEEYRHHFRVKCEKTGRIVNIPHPVAALRIWNANELKYDEIDPALEGAPSQADKETWWADFIKCLKEQRGHEYIKDLLANEPAEDEQQIC